MAAPFHTVCQAWPTVTWSTSPLDNFLHTAYSRPHPLTVCGGRGRPPSPAGARPHPLPWGGGRPPPPPRAVPRPPVPGPAPHGPPGRPPPPLPRRVGTA